MNKSKTKFKIIIKLVSGNYCLEKILEIFLNYDLIFINKFIFCIIFCFLIILYNELNQFFRQWIGRS